MNIEKTNMQYFIKYGRKNGLISLKILLENLKNPDAITACKNAVNYIDGCLRYQRLKGTGRYR